MNAPDEDAIRHVWSNYWSNTDEVAPWDTLSEFILRTLEREARGFEHRAILEAGCGTGRISHRVALAGAEVTCLDITTEALDLARQTFGSTPGRFQQGSILALPRDSSYHLVWNAGVLEHFTPEDQRTALAEFLAVLRPEGRAVLFTPYARSPLYRLGKAVLEGLGRWPYGVEIPKTSLSDCLPPGRRLAKEYSMAFLPLLLDAHKFLRPLQRPLRWLWVAMLERWGIERLVRWDRKLSDWFGGYLLVSVLEADPGTEPADG